MPEERDPRPGGRRAADAGAEGTLSRLLLEIAQAPEEDLEDSWRAGLSPGDHVGRYEIRREIGHGGFGAVYEAFDPELGRLVALKALRPKRTRSELSQAWIKQEAEAVAKLDHPAIVTIFDVGTCPAGAYLVMELLHGETLAQRIEKGPLPVDEALRVAERMAEGLAHAHSRGVLHRDLKPANVFVCDDGRVKLLDFGLAHLLGTEGSSGGGTPAYMAPEQARGEAVDKRIDVYAAAVVLGETIAGKRPVPPAISAEPVTASPEGDTERLWEPDPDAIPAPAPRPGLGNLPRPVARLVGAGVSVNPEERPADGNAWLSAVRHARDAIERPRRARRVAVLAGIGIAIGLGVAGVATWRVWERQIPGGRPTVAVADFANETGEKELDGISGLLITALEQGTQLRVLTRGRMLDVLKQLGSGLVDRIDEPLARKVGRETRADVLLLASIRKLGGMYVVEMRALDPLHDEYLFTLSDRASGTQAVFDLVDRLGAATRRRLGVGGAEAVLPVTSITTGSVKAWELLSESRRAFHRDEIDEAKRLAEAAVKEDPDFALAHYQLALASFWHLAGQPEASPEQRARVEAAERVASRLPDKERISLQALRAQLDARWEDAIRLWDQVAQANPLDKEAVLLAGDVRFHRQQIAASIPFFQRVLQLDPASPLATEHLVWAMVLAGSSGEHVSWLQQKAATSRVPDELNFVAVALLDAGREEDAVAAWRRSISIRGGRWPPGSYARSLVMSGRAPEAEAALRQDLATIPPELAARKPRLVPARKEALAMALLGQGRFREALALQGAAPVSPSDVPVLRLYAAVASGSARDIAPAVGALEAMGELDDPAALVAGVLHLTSITGERQSTGRLVERVHENPRRAELGPFESALLDGIAARARGERDEARRRFRAFAAGEHVFHRFWGHAFLAALARDEGDCAGVVAELEQTRAVGTAWPADDRIAFQSVMLDGLAACYEQLGDLAKARERNDELLRRWENADPDVPILVEAKARQVRLAVK